MSVHAITPIQHGLADGTVVHIAIGDELVEGEDFSADALRALIANESAVELGSNRKYSTAPDPSVDPGAADTATRLRDELIARSKSTAGDAEPTAEAVPASEGQE